MNSKQTLPILILSLLLISTACVDLNFFPCIKPSGEVVEEIRITDDFNAINVLLPANVYVTLDTYNSISIVSTENILEHISTSARGQTLYIDNTQCMQTSDDDIVVFITTPDINSVKLSGSGNIYLNSPFTGQDATLEISGSGNIYCSYMNYEHLTTSISGSGTANLIGDVKNHRVQISGSGKVNAFELFSEYAQIQISGSGQARVNVWDHLDAGISGSGNIYYSGNPTVNINISGSGAVYHIVNNFED